MVGAIWQPDERGDYTVPGISDFMVRADGLTQEEWEQLHSSKPQEAPMADEQNPNDNPGVRPEPFNAKDTFKRPDLQPIHNEDLIVATGVSREDMLKALEEDWGATDVEAWKLRKTAEKRGWQVNNVAHHMTDEQQRRLNMIMSGYATPDELERAKAGTGIKHVEVTQERLAMVALDVIKLVMEKNHDYGDAWQALGQVGAAARFVDKLFRIEKLANGQEALVVDEKLLDTVRDKVGYGLLILLYDRYVGVDNPVRLR